MTLRSSTIFISVGDETHVYRSLEDVPPSLRRKLEESTSGINSSTILIADRNGREELMKALQGKSNHLQFRVSASRPAEPVAQHVPALKDFWDKHATWVEIGGIGVLGLLIWALFLFK